MVFAHRISERSEMRSSWIRVALNPMTGILERDRRGDIEEKLHEDRGRDGTDAATSPRMPGTPEGGRCRKGPPLEPQEGAQPCPAWIWAALPRLDLRFLASRVARRDTLLQLKHQVWDPWLELPQDTHAGITPDLGNDETLRKFEHLAETS